jgi:hypothetical protein
MTDTHEPVEDTLQKQDTTQKQDTQKDVPSDTDLVEKLVKERLASELKDIKSKLDSAYGARDEALKKIAEHERKEKDAELARLKEEGKHKEAYELQLAEERAKRELLEKRNVELTRDIDVRNALGHYPFRSDTALEMAYREIVSQLVTDDSGIWKHRSGISIKDFVKTFAESEANEFLLKTKANSGSGSHQTKTEAPPKGPRSLFSMPQEEVLKLAAEGKLR